MYRHSELCSLVRSRGTEYRGGYVAGAGSLFAAETSIDNGSNWFSIDWVFVPYVHPIATITRDAFRTALFHLGFTRKPRPRSKTIREPEEILLGPIWIATPLSYRTCIDCSLPVSRRTAKESGHYPTAAPSTMHACDRRPPMPIASSACIRAAFSRAAVLGLR
jgi:hypothetical protein